jgi:hypothetical protein
MQFPTGIAVRFNGLKLLARTLVQGIGFACISLLRRSPLTQRLELGRAIALQ